MKSAWLYMVLFLVGFALVVLGQNPPVRLEQEQQAPAAEPSHPSNVATAPGQLGAEAPSSQAKAQGAGGGAGTAVANLVDVKRIYVAPLTGGKGRETLRDLIIASVSASHEFVITENEERADATLKGAADDEVFNEHFNANDSTSVHANVGIYGAAVKGAGRGPGGYAGQSASEHSSSREEERKHEAYAAVRLCNKDGDVIWSTTQESPGGKFRGAGADVAAKVARQLVMDMEKARRREFETVSAGGAGLAPASSSAQVVSVPNSIRGDSTRRRANEQ